MTGDEPEMLAEGRYLRFLRRGRWEYVERRNCHGIVAMVAVTAERELVLVEQLRPAVGRRVLDLPAGLVGDVDGDDTLEDAARRELLEETGYRCGRLERIMASPPSPGLSAEITTFFRAHDLERVHEGGGDESERIVVRHAPLDGIDAWLAAREAEGVLIELKLWAGLHFVS